MITVPFSDLYQKVLTDWLTGTDSLDAAVFAPQWSVDYVVPGLLEDLSERVAADTMRCRATTSPISSASSRRRSTAAPT